ncbi:bacillithiol system redox-active protein YtxJ [Paenibacillus sp. J5C_2022]|uniref:bacillithiol system redox-active protein YtxJ n=1 Tax=Paenibacillus sp. J5C2022 TaxID=2977129 RepID=UPI0021D2FD17|nr:bacillithiol system redox-active protein YtxJ [Paenibacillus sp. J5C2022]MCU6710701.1 bacillithiol system redox-active protein YtxJ [Paenibacillus sp. J5C2022]
MLQLLQSNEELNTLIAQSHYAPVILYKHSTKCGTSHAAHYRLQMVMNQTKAMRLNIIYAMVKVRECKALSEEIADRLSVKHVSPQVLIIHLGRAVWHASHQRIQGANIMRALQSLPLSRT